MSIPNYNNNNRIYIV